MNISEMDRNRLIDAEWQDDGASDEVYQAEINIYVQDKVGVLVEVARIFTESEINVTAMTSRSSKNHTATINVAFDIKGRSQLQKVIDKLRSLECVYDIERTRG